jgi:parvulin-like peptidyl-prolyl isomerase
MTAVLQIGQKTLTIAELLELLQQAQLMPRLVQEVVLQAALAAIDCDPEEACQTFCQQQQLFTEEQRQAWLAQRQMSAEQLTALALREVKLTRFKEATWGSQVESYFLQRKSQLDRVLYSLIRIKEAGLAQEIYFRVHDDGESFVELAREYSEGQEAQTGGLIGPVELSVPHPVLARMLSVSQPGQVWSPTPIGEWFVIARLEKFLPAQFDPATRQRLLDELFKSWLQQQLQQTVVQPLVAESERVLPQL